MKKAMGIALGSVVMIVITFVIWRLALPVIDILSQHLYSFSSDLIETNSIWEPILSIVRFVLRQNFSVLAYVF